MQIDRDGVSIHYEVTGSGPTILLSHGFGATAGMWEPQLEVLGAGHQVVTWDMRGHGQSDSPADQGLYSEEATVADMAAILDAVGASKAVIGGLSLGGYMSLAFNVAHPDRVTALLLFDTGPGYRSDEPRDKWNRMAHRSAANLEEKGLDALGASSEVLGARHRDPMGLARAARGMLAQREARIIDSLPGISGPTLVLVGEQDTGYLTATDYMASRIPGAVKVTIPGAGHAANLDRPEEFNRAVLDFLGTLPG
ncbi:MAG TPA: alpha/beta fold hydrolase [Acidimicrobiales bacterium]|nr:alpha/beta fold hydrolase [Acidimicrobiales bacterium]